jgi:hypothetical protein
MASEVQQDFNITISAQTVRNRLREKGFKGQVPRKKPFISKTNMTKRFNWAKIHQNWTVDDWKKVIWSDESKFNLFGSDGVRKVWRKPGEEYKPECMKKTVKHGGGSVMVWGAMALNGVGNLHFIDDIMTKEVYKDVLENNLFSSARKLRMRRNFIFQQDNDPKHTAKILQKYFEEKRINVLPWVAQSPDLNPIEHLWAELERRTKGRHPKCKEELKTILSTAWNEISSDVTKKLVESMPRRVQAVIEAKGGSTKY